MLLSVIVQFFSIIRLKRMISGRVPKIVITFIVYISCLNTIFNFFFYSHSSFIKLCFYLDIAIGYSIKILL